MERFLNSTVRYEDVMIEDTIRVLFIPKKSTLIFILGQNKCYDFSDDVIDF